MRRDFGNFTVAMLSGGITPNGREAVMVTRLVCAIVALLFAFSAFYGVGPTAGGALNPFGLLFLGIAAFIWFAWRPMTEGFNRLGIWDAITGGWLSSRDGEQGKSPSST
jgi:hypothetical protein